VVQLNRLIERLCDANIDFVVVGGFAGMLHGSTLVTRDLDVCTILLIPACWRGERALVRRLGRCLCRQMPSTTISFITAQRCMRPS
jgi:hypothetical protein